MTNLTSVRSFVYQQIANNGNSAAERLLFLYIDGQWQAKQHVNYLSPGKHSDLTLL